MVPPSMRRIIRSHTCPYIAIEHKWPRHCTDAMHRHTVSLSGATEHPLGAVLCSSKTCVGWTTEEFMKRRFIWCWSKILGASLSNLNEGVGWTAGQGVGSSGAEATELQSISLPNPRSPDEPMLGPSVHPTVTFEYTSRRTHPTHLEKLASVHPTLCFEI
jgi:hypothetical protein